MHGTTKRYGWEERTNRREKAKPRFSHASAPVVNESLSVIQSFPLTSCPGLPEPQTEGFHQTHQKPAEARPSQQLQEHLTGLQEHGEWQVRWNRLGLRCSLESLMASCLLPYYFLFIQHLNPPLFWQLSSRPLWCAIYSTSLCDCKGHTNVDFVPSSWLTDLPLSVLHSVMPRFAAFCISKCNSPNV